jgi:sporulation protein YlmC with PRC-barrel domain
MMRAIAGLTGDAVVARDGRIGAVDDVYFDDEKWAVRYFVVDTGNWLPGRKVLISPASLAPQEGDADSLQADLTKQQVEGAPDAGEHPPVSRTLEEAHAKYYGYTYYWAGPYLWGAAPVPHAALPPLAGATAPQRAEGRASRERHESELRAAEKRARESHLRSASEVTGYRIRASDGEIGRVEDFVVDDADWSIADMVVDTTAWLPGGRVLVPPSAISDIDWERGEVSVRLSREQLRRAPAAP